MDFINRPLPWKAPSKKELFYYTDFIEAAFGEFKLKGERKFFSKWRTTKMTKSASKERVKYRPCNRREVNRRTLQVRILIKNQELLVLPDSELIINPLQVELLRSHAWLWHGKNFRVPSLQKDWTEKRRASSFQKSIDYFKREGEQEVSSCFFKKTTQLNEKILQATTEQGSCNQVEKH